MAAAPLHEQACLAEAPAPVNAGQPIRDAAMRSLLRQEPMTLDYLRARWMASAAGRLTQPDSWQPESARPGPLGAWTHADLRPTDLIDPSGDVSVGDAPAAGVDVLVAITWMAKVGRPK